MFFFLHLPLKGNIGNKRGMSKGQSAQKQKWKLPQHINTILENWKKGLREKGFLIVEYNEFNLVRANVTFPLQHEQELSQHTCKKVSKGTTRKHLFGHIVKCGYT